MTWKEVLDSWEHKISMAEQALDKNASWEDVIADEITIDDSMGAPPRDLYARYEMLTQRTTALEKRITEQGEVVLAEISALSEARGSHRNAGVFATDRISAALDMHA